MSSFISLIDMVFAILLVLLNACTTFGNFIPNGDLTQTRSDLPYPLVPAVFSGTVAGQPFNLTGNINQVAAQLRELYPQAALSLGFASFGKGSSEDTAAGNGTGMARRSKLPPQCNKRADWMTAYATIIHRGGIYLRDFHETQKTWIGPRSCTQISCETAGDGSGSEIVLCNDNNYGIQPRTGYLGEYALESVAACQYWSIPWGRLVKSQQFDTDNYNIICKGRSGC